MTYSEAIRYLYSFISYERKAHWTYSDKTLNLDRFRQFLSLLGNPQDGFRSIHVAGSDGKGSVCAMLASVLRTMGYRVGVFSSPHLHNIRERIAIDGEWISKAVFTRWTDFLRRAAEKDRPLPSGYVTFFEMITAMAFLHFQKERVDFAVIETGLGGRLDTTNVMHPCASVITHISLEHTEQLGDTLEAIADEKLGIIRPDVPVIVGHQIHSLLPHFRLRLKNHPAPVIETDRSYRIRSHSCGRHYRTIELERLGKEGNVRSIRIPLFGHYQMDNTVTAVATLDTLTQSGVLPPLSIRCLDRGLRYTQWPGRFEIVRRDKKSLAILDVAHTARGAESLRLSLDEQFPKHPRIFVAGFLQDKKIRDMVQVLIRPSDTFIVTEAPTPRAASVETIREKIEGIPELGPQCLYIQNPKQAWKKAEQLATRKHLICVTGSLYLVGSIRQTILSSRASR